MANKDDYLRNYREFFEYFAQTVNPNDQLPVKLASYKFLNVEVVGGIIDWTTQYLTQKKCPPHLFSPLIKIIIDETRKSCKKQPVTCGFNSAENAYEPLKLMQAVMAKTNEVCLRYLDNSMLCSLPSPSNTFYETSIYAIRNKRRKMEDRHVAINDLNTLFNIQEASPSSYYAIFDGHAGHDAAAYSAAHLHQFLAENKYFVTNPEQALLDAFCKTDALFIEKCKVENLNGGTTAVVALLRPKEKTLYVAWVGDSQALLVKQGKILQCVNPHKPCREDERERIEKAGGCVMLWGTWRVNGQLAVSRAIGDVDYKPHVIAIPDVREISLDGDEDFLIIACDGLWDYLSEDAAAQEVYYLIAENPDDTERISNNLSQLARYEGSADNISVIVVFLREPHKIAAEAQRWATRNGPPLTTDNMEAGLDNANNPFTNSNGSLKNLDVETDNIHLQKSNEGLLLNLTDNFKANGTDLSQDIFEKSNGTKNSSSDIHFDDGFGPETDVDAVDDAFSPVEKSKTFAECLSKAFNDEGLPKSFNDEVKAFSEGLANNNPLGNDFNPFLSKELEDRSKDDIKEDFEEHGGDNREETPTPPVDTVHDVGGLEENPGESDSEDEWNYFKGDQAKPETLPSQPETVISQSPKRPVAVDIKVPNETEFESEVKSRPSDFDAYSNGHDSDSEHNVSGTEQMENILNGKSIDEIPEFQPGSTPAKQPSTDEFHFGPNAAPFTPRPLDQSEALSTKANYGDDTEQTLNTSFNDSELAIPHKDSGDPMSMSFSAERGELNPFQDEEDLNKVHDLPENIDEFLENVDNKENWTLDGTISDLPQHDVLGYLDNDQAAIQTTDLDKLSQEDEKELASPLEPEQDLQNIAKISSATPDLLEGGVAVPEKLTTDDSNISSLPELEPLSAAQLQGVSFIPEPQPGLDESKSLPGQPDFNQEVQAELLESKSPVPVEQETKKIQQESDLSDSRLSPLPGQLDLRQQEVQSVSPTPEEVDLLQSKSPISAQPEPEKQETNLLDVDDKVVKESDVLGELKSQGPVEEFTSGTKSPFDDIFESKSPVCQLKPSDMFETEFNPKREVETLELEAKISDLSRETALACEFSADPAVCELQQHSSEAMPVSHSPFDSQQEYKQDEEITSSIKDDISSPIELLSPVKSPEPLVDESFTADHTKPVESEPVIIEDSFVQQEEHHTEAPQGFSTQDLLGNLVCPMPQSQQLFNEPLVQTNEFTRFEASAPLEPSPFTELSNGFNNFATAFTEQFSIKTDSIKPEFAEPAVITPSEDSKIVDEVFAAPLSEIPAQESLQTEVKSAEPIITSQEVSKELPVLAPLPIVPVVPQETKEIKKEEKKSSTATAGKKPIGKVAPSKSSTAPSKPSATSKVPATKSSSKPVASSPKTGVPPRVPSKTGPLKPATTAAKAASSTTAATKPLLKPKTAPAPKPIEKKPLTNGDVKPAPRTTLTKRPSAETATKTTTRPATSAAAKTSPTKTTAPRPATAPRPTPPKLSASAPKPPVGTTTAPKPRVPLASRPTTTSSTSKLVTSTTTSKTTTATTNRPSLSPRTPTAPPKPKTITYNAPKPRVPLTKTITKSADVEKEKKESANKLTASRTTTVTKTSSASATSRTATTTVKKTETKPLSHRPAVSKTSTTTTKTTVSKKPGEVKSVTKTKTTKVEKPKENGVAPTNITEEIKEITIVNNIVNETENLFKDNSPLDNKLITETSALIDVNPAD